MVWDRKQSLSEGLGTATNGYDCASHVNVLTDDASHSRPKETSSGRLATVKAWQVFQKGMKTLAHAALHAVGTPAAQVLPPEQQAEPWGQRRRPREVRPRRTRRIARR